MVDSLSSFHHITPANNQDDAINSVLQHSASMNLQQRLHQHQSTGGHQQILDEDQISPYKYLSPQSNPSPPLPTNFPSSAIMKEQHFQQQHQQQDQQQQQQQQFPSHLKDIYSHLFHQSPLQQSSLQSFHRFSQMNMVPGGGIGGMAGPHHHHHPDFSIYDGYNSNGGKIPLGFARVWLDHQSLWRRFSMSGNEMIITKMGRLVI